MHQDSRYRFVYSYGIIGYLMKYLGAIFFILLFVIFAGLLVMILFAGMYSESPLQVVMAVSIFVPMTAFSGLGAYYCIRYGRYFTKEFRFSEDALTIFDGGVRDSSYRWEDLEAIIYRKWLTVFELHFRQSDTVIVLMNNGQNRTDAFYALEELLLSIGGVHKKVSRI